MWRRSVRCRSPPSVRSSRAATPLFGQDGAFEGRDAVRRPARAAHRWSGGVQAVERSSSAAARAVPRPSRSSDDSARRRIRPRVARPFDGLEQPAPVVAASVASTLPTPLTTDGMRRVAQRTAGRARPRRWCAPGPRRPRGASGARSSTDADPAELVEQRGGHVVGRSGGGPPARCALPRGGS